MSVAVDLTYEPEPTDARLALDGRGGCNLALTELHRRYHLRLVRFCQGYVGDRALAEDTAQETMLRAIRFLGAYDSERPMWPWLRVIAKRQCLTLLRARSQEHMVAALPETHTVVRDEVDGLLDRITLQNALAGLPDRQRRAVQLRYLEGCDRDTSAAILGVNRNAFDQLLARARTRLAASFQGQRAGVAVLALLRPFNRLRSRLRTGAARQAAGAAGVAVTSAQFLGVSALVVIAGTALINPGHAQGAVTPPETRTALTATSGVAASGGRPASVPITHHAAATSPRIAAGVGAPGATGQVDVAQHPLAPGQAQRHRITVHTAFTTITVGGHSDRDAGDGLVCGTGLVDCGD